MNKTEVMKKYVNDEMSKFKNPYDIKQFISTLNLNQLFNLCKWLSDWRKNNTFNYIFNGPDNWLVSKISISDIRIQEVNDKVNHLLKRCDYSLEKISQDKEICNHNEFKSQGNINEKYFLAVKEGNRFKIFDGIHRAVRLVCDGTKELELIYRDNDLQNQLTQRL